MIDAADALAAWASSPSHSSTMIRMLSSDQAAVRMAALRGMSQIGGKDALPAAEYIAQNISTPTKSTPSTGPKCWRSSDLSHASPHCASNPSHPESRRPQRCQLGH